MHTIYIRNIINSRNKDYYDIYIIMKLKKDEINYDHLKGAFENTFKYRKTELNINEIKNTLEKVLENKIMRERWKKYCEDNSFANNIEFNDVISSCFKLIRFLEK